MEVVLYELRVSLVFLSFFFSWFLLRASLGASSFLSVGFTEPSRRRKRFLRLTSLLYESLLQFIFNSSVVPQRPSIS